MNGFKLTVLLCTTLAMTACAKKDAGGESGEKAADGLAWTPMNYKDMTPTCKKDLACCEDIAKAERGASKAEDYNGACSGPALWSEADCKTDLASRLAGKTVPASCK